MTGSAQAPAAAKPTLICCRKGAEVAAASMTWSAPRSRSAAALSGPRATATTVAPRTLLICNNNSSRLVTAVMDLGLPATEGPA